MYRLGYDYFTSELEDTKNRVCKVCNTICDFKPNLFGPRSSIQAMSGYKSKFNKYSCPNNKEKWHYKAYRILKCIEDMPSDSVAEIMQKDLDKILKNNGCLI